MKFIVLFRPGDESIRFVYVSTARDVLNERPTDNNYLCQAHPSWLLTYRTVTSVALYVACLKRAEVVLFHTYI